MRVASVSDSALRTRLVSMGLLNIWNPRLDAAVGQNQWYHFGVGALPILVYFDGDWDVHRGYDLDFDPWPCSPRGSKSRSGFRGAHHSGKISRI